MHKEVVIGLAIAALLLSSTIVVADTLCSKLCPGLFGRGGTEETVVKGPGIKTEKGWVEVPYNRTTKTVDLPTGKLTYGYTCKLPTNEIGWGKAYEEGVNIDAKAETILIHAMGGGKLGVGYSVKGGEGWYSAYIFVDKPTYYIVESEAKSAVNKKVNEAKSAVRSGGYVDRNYWEKVDVRNRTINGNDCVELVFRNESRSDVLEHYYITDKNVVYELRFRADEAIYKDMDKKFFEPVLKSFKTSVSLKE